MAREKIDPSERMPRSDVSWSRPQAGMYDGYDNMMLIGAWLAFMESGNRLGTRTVRRYLSTLYEFESWLSDKPEGPNLPDLQFGKVTRQEIMWFMEYLEHDRIIVDTRDGEMYRAPLSASSRKNALAALRCFYRWFMQVDPDRQVDPTVGIDRPKVTTTKGDVLTRDELDALLYHPLGDVRERIQCWLLAYTGCRVEEVATLRWMDVDLSNDVLHVVGKGTKRRVVDILEPLKIELLTWQRRQARDAEKNEAIAQALSNRDTAFVLLTKSGKPVATTTLWRSLKRRAARAGVRPLDVGTNKHGRRKDLQSEVTPHMLRRGLGTYLLEEGVHIDAVADILGHEDISTTRKHYTNPRDDRRRDAMRRFRAA